MPDARPPNVQRHALELFFDDAGDRAVRDIWRSLDQAGVQSLGAVPGTRYRPHVSLAVFESLGDGFAARVATALEPCRGLTVELASLGFFLTAESVAFLGVTPNAELLEAHKAVVGSLSGLVGGSSPYYRPGHLHFHCTLAVGVHDRSTVVEVVARHRLPIVATVKQASIVQSSTGEEELTVDLPTVVRHQGRVT